MDALTKLPASFAAGTTIKYTRTYSDFPADQGWTLTLYIRGSAVRTYVAAASGSSHVFTIPASGGTPPADGTDTLAAGTYVWEERASKAGDVYTPPGARGSVEILANTATALAGALQSQAEKDLAVVEAKIAGRLSADLEEYEIAGRSVKKIPIRELYLIRNRLRAEIRAARNKGGFGETVRATFGSIR